VAVPISSTGSPLCAEGSLSVVGRSPEEAHDGPSTLRVQSGGRLVQEQEKLGLCSKLGSDGQPLPLFDTQGTNNGVGILLQTTHQEIFLNIRLLLHHGNIPRLTKNSREEDRLADGRGGLRHIHLLTVPGLRLEVRWEGLTVHEAIATNVTDGRALGEDVQKGVYFQARSKLVGRS
jgi:hypothetical protein